MGNLGTIKEVVYRNGNFKVGENHSGMEVIKIIEDEKYLWVTFADKSTCRISNKDTIIYYKNTDDGQD